MEYIYLPFKIIYEHGYFVHSYPLMNLPLPTNAPLQFVMPIENYSIPPILAPSGDGEGSESEKRPRWVSVANSKYKTAA